MNGEKNINLPRTQELFTVATTGARFQQNTATNNKVLVAPRSSAFNLDRSAQIKMFAGEAARPQARIPLHKMANQPTQFRSLSTVMQASATIDVEPVEAKPAPEYKPQVFDNKFVKKSDVGKNPLFNLTSIGVEARNGKLPKIESLQDLLKNSNEFISDRIEKVRDDPKYWVQQGVRTGFFISSGLAAARQQKLDLFAKKEGSTADEKIDLQKSKLEEYISLLQDYEMLYDLEAKNIKEGYYKAPWTGEVGHRELNPAWAATKIQEFLASSKTSNVIKESGKKADVFVSGMYPDYYMENTHFQSEGWLSARTADSYEFAMETLFTGSLDTIQRLTLTPVHFWLKDTLKDDSDIKVLEVGGGSGRYMTFFRDNYPKMDTTLLDLSPFFLEQAAKNDRYFRSFFNRQDKRAKDDNVKPSELKLYQGQAEKMMEFEDGQFDILNCVNLFTSIPSDVRKECAKEFFRVLAPGGIVCFNDSVQMHDRAGEVPDLVKQSYNADFFESYQAEDLNEIFFAAGFKPGPTSPIIAAQSKVISWVKPLESETAEEIKVLQEKSLEFFKFEIEKPEEKETKAEDEKKEEVKMEATTTEVKEEAAEETTEAAAEETQAQPSDVEVEAETKSDTPIA